MNDTIRRIEFLLREENNFSESPLVIPSELRGRKEYTLSYAGKMYSKLKNYPLTRLRAYYLEFVENVRKVGKEEEILDIINKAFRTKFSSLDKLAHLPIDDSKSIITEGFGSSEAVDFAFRLSLPIQLALKKYPFMKWPAIIFISFLYLYQSIAGDLPEVLKRLRKLSRVAKGEEEEDEMDRIEHERWGNRSSRNYERDYERGYKGRSVGRSRNPLDIKSNPYSDL